MGRSLGQVEQRGCRRVGANAIVVAVRADKRAVKADVAGIERRNAAQLCRQEIRFGHAVLAVKVLHNGEFDLLAALFVHGFARNRADEDVQALALDHLGRLAGHLLGGKVRQQVGDNELRVGRLVAYAHLHALDLAVLAHADNAAQLERNGRPLILLDAAVVVGLEERHAVVLVQRHGADINTRRIEVRGGQAHALGEALFANNSQHDALVTVDAVDLVARTKRVIARPGTEALALSHAGDFQHSVTLGFALVKEFFVTLGVGLNALLVLVGQTVKAGLFVVKKLFGSHVAFSFFNPNHLMS